MLDNDQTKVLASTDLKYFTDAKIMHPVIKGVLTDMGFSETRNPLDNVTIAWICCRSKCRPFPHSARMVNRLSNETEFADKLHLVQLLNTHDRIMAFKKLSKFEYKEVRHPNGIPNTYSMGSAIMRQELQNHAKEDDYWIMKPTCLSRGRGIQIIKGNEELIKILRRFNMTQQKYSFAPRTNDPFLIQKYIKNPLLLNKKKFDIRCFMVIASTKPFLVFHDPGYVRISLNDFVLDDQDNATHLTNQCIQEKKKGYRAQKEDTVWSIEQLNEYLNETFCNCPKYKKDYAIKNLQAQQRNILKRVIVGMRTMANRKDGEFGIYGCDFIIDENFRVFLLEINIGPSLKTNTEVLESVIPRVLRHAIRIAIECFDKKQLGLPLRPIQTPTTMKIIYAENSPAIHLFRGIRSAENYLKRVRLIGSYKNDLKTLVIERISKNAADKQIKQ